MLVAVLVPQAQPRLEYRRPPLPCTAAWIATRKSRIRRSRASRRRAFGSKPAAPAVCGSCGRRQPRSRTNACNLGQPEGAAEARRKPPPKSRGSTRQIQCPEKQRDKELSTLQARLHGREIEHGRCRVGTQRRRRTESAPFFSRCPTTNDAKIQSAPARSDHPTAYPRAGFAIAHGGKYPAVDGRRTAPGNSVDANRIRIPVCHTALISSAGHPRGAHGG